MKARRLVVCLIIVAALIVVALWHPSLTRMAGAQSVHNAAEHLLMGNPSGATTDINNPNNYLMEKTQYVLSYSRDRGTPNWVSWHLDSSWITGVADRQDDYRADTSLPSGWYQVQGSDYDFNNTGFQRGHMCPSGDRTSSVADNSATFLMTNFIPQSPDNNQGPWEKLETELRNIVRAGNEVYIISGPYGVGGQGEKGGITNTITNGHVTVPQKTWKVALVLPVGDNDISRVTASTRAIAVIMPNTQGIRNDPWQKYLVSVDQVEALTGYNFFSNVPQNIQAAIESKVDGTPAGSSIQFGQPGYSIREDVVVTSQGYSSLLVDVTRTGDISAPATVQYSTSDKSFDNECNQNTGQASQRCDYATAAGTLRFAAGESSKVISIPIINDGYVEGPEVFTIELQPPVGATLGANSKATITIVDSGVATTSSNNPYLSNEFFVRMNYLDFLAREPDAEGWATWPPLLNGCGPEKGFLGAPPDCDRAHVSHGFFGSPEFTNRGFLIYRMYAVGMNRLLRYSEFIPDMASLSGFGLSDAIQQQNLFDYLQQFTSKIEFTTRFSDALLPSQAETLIQKLEQTAGVTLPATATTNPGQPQQYGRQELINLRAAGALTVGQTVKAFVEQQVVYDRYFTEGEVTMMYFAYLKRDPDLNDPNLLGWKDWVFVFTNGGAQRGRPDIPARDIHHLIFGFIYSEEYRKRFGAP
ncbi:MAG: DNA/RNA non-specific endonuclease [Pyrinomonadaceae bacterium]|nr:DNA/RNA non-specific endonuclease [Pyrinomonadaceae bacterium]